MQAIYKIRHYIYRCGPSQKKARVGLWVVRSLVRRVTTDHVSIYQRPETSARCRMGDVVVLIVKGCTHRAMIPCDGAVDTHRKEYSQPIAQWEHLSFATFVFPMQLKLLAMAFDQDLACLIFTLRWACFPIKSSRNAQWVHLFSMYFDDFSTINLTLFL